MLLLLLEKDLKCCSDLLSVSLHTSATFYQGSLTPCSVSSSFLCLSECSSIVLLGEFRLHATTGSGCIFYGA